MPTMALRHKEKSSGSGGNGAKPDASHDLVADRLLAHSIVKGDHKAFDQLYGKYQARVFNYALRVGGNSEDAAEATQETFVAFLRRLPRVDIDSLNVLPYLFACARYECLTNYRKRQRATKVLKRLEGSEQSQVLEDDPERQALFNVQTDQVAEANARLPERYREVLALREINGLDYDQIGEALGLKRNAVAQLILRSRLRLLDELRKGAIQRPSGGPDCKRALPLLSGYIDSELKGEEKEWLTRHINSCKSCRINLDCVNEAVISYRSWLPLPALAVSMMTKNADALMAEAAKRKALSVATVRAVVRSRAFITSVAIVGVAAMALIVPAALRDGDQLSGTAPVTSDLGGDRASKATPAKKGKKSKSKASDSEATGGKGDTSQDRSSSPGSSSSSSGGKKASKPSSSRNGTSPIIGPVDSSPDSQPGSSAPSSGGSGGSTQPPKSAPPSECVNPGCGSGNAKQY